MLDNVFSDLQLTDGHLKLIISLLPQNCLVSKFISLMETGGAKQPSKGFKPLLKKDYETMSNLVKPLLPK
jgi:hypothetical protein